MYLCYIQNVLKRIKRILVHDIHNAEDEFF